MVGPVLLMLSGALEAQQQKQGFPAEIDRLGVSRGNPDAELVVREFADYQCPACKAFYPTVKRLIDKYVKSGRVRFVFFDFPLDMHKHAVTAAEAARCAGLQDAYWPMHDALFENQDEWAKAQQPVALFTRYAGELGIDGQRLADCVRDDRTREVVERNRELAGQLRIRSTPTLIVGDRGMRGVVSWAQVSQAVEQALSGEQPASKRIEPEPLDPNRELNTVDSNRLTDATSPYLRLHADNPVDWYPWGEAAFAKARRENKPVFLSIGYFTCYWCHVMERESFADAQVADLLNRYFVLIKVDREQRPGVDSLYMRAINILGQRGGWPLSMFLTPELEPFFGGTYYPKPQFMDALQQINAIWNQDRGRITNAADQITGLLGETERAAGVDGRGKLPSTQYLSAAGSAFARSFDAEHGGFGPAPKFPQPSILLFLLDRHVRTGDKQPLEMVVETLDAMASGGIHDHLGGGFHRYSTDTRWHVPHFEKMLYDNAQLLEVYARAAAITGNARYRAVVEGIVRYLDSTLTDADTGLLYSAQSSLVHEQEGESYIWTDAQFREVLGGERQYRIARLRYGLDRGPDLDGAHVLHLARTPEEIAAHIDALDPVDVEAMLPAIDKALLEARNQREQAPVGTKHVLSWNAMAVRALSIAGAVMDKPAYIERAAGLANALMQHLYNTEGGPWRAIRGEAPGQVGAQSFDYAALVSALVELERASGNSEHGQTAARVASDMIERLWNPDRGLFNRRADSATLLVETTALRDGAVPAGNSVAALALTGLAQAGFSQYAPYAATVLRAHERIMERNANSLPLMLTALAAYHDASLPSPVAVPARERVKARRVAHQSPDAPAGKRDKGDQTRPGLQLEGIGGGVASSGADSVFSGAKVDLTATRDARNPRRLRFELSVEKGWHVNANPASLDFLVPTEVGIYAGDREVAARTTYPSAHQVPAEALGEGPIDVYSGAVEITSLLPSSVDPDTALDATVRIQACNEKGRCLAPDSLKTTIDP